MRLARVEGGIAVEIVEVPDTVDELVTPAREEVRDEDGEIVTPAADAEHRTRPAVADDYFHRDLAFVAAGDDVEVGMSYASGTFGAAPPPPPRPAAELAALACRLADRRDEAGTVVDGRPLGTDAETLAILAEAREAIAADPGWSTDLRLPDGTWLVVDTYNVAPLIAAVTGHRAASRARRRALEEAIAAGTLATDAEAIALFNEA